MNGKMWFVVVTVVGALLLAAGVAGFAIGHLHPLEKAALIVVGSGVVGVALLVRHHKVRVNGR